MPGRTLAGTTTEGFTSKERDAATQLDYFGARYYMPALGRWTSMDPLADSFPAWNGYNYVEGNPVGLVDLLGLSPIDDIFYDLNSREVERISTDAPDRHFLRHDGETYRLDYQLVEGAQPYSLVPASSFDIYAQNLGDSGAPYANKYLVAFHSLPRMSLDFKKYLPDRSLWHTGGNLVAHKHAVGNAAWGFYMAKAGYTLEETLEGARRQGTIAGGEDPLDQLMIRRGYALHR